jgi:hypothetical protein
MNAVRTVSYIFCNINFRRLSQQLLSVVIVFTIRLSLPACNSATPTWQIFAALLISDFYCEACPESKDTKVLTLWRLNFFSSNFSTPCI